MNINNNPSPTPNPGTPTILEQPRTSISLELGDIIEIKAPSNNEIHELVGYISFINPAKIIVVDTANPERRYQMNINEHGFFTDESIKEIHLLSRDDKKGYARQNNLLPSKWVTIHFGGDVPTVITGQITDLIEDMIEITTYPDIQTVIYIDFEYNGIPEHIPIEKIVIRKPPATFKDVDSLASLRGEDDESEYAEVAHLEMADTGEATIRVPENVVPDANIREELRDLYLDANSIVFEELGELTQMVEVPEGEQRYGVEIQINDLMDELLSTIPNSQRTKTVLDNIHRLIERFKQLRNQYSVFDDNYNISDVKTSGALHKPLIERIQKLDTRLQWLLPVIVNRKHLYNVEYDDESETVVEEKAETLLRRIEKTQMTFKNGSDRNLTYSAMNNSISNDMATSDTPLAVDKYLVSKQVNTNLESIIDNLGDFYTTVYARSEIENRSQVSRRRYVIEKYNLGMNKMQEQITKSGKKNYKKTQMTPNDTMTIKSFIMLPEPVMRSSKMYLPTTTILDKTNYSQTPFYLFKILRKNTNLLTNVIEDLEHEFDYGDSVDKESKLTFLKGIQEFVLSEDLNSSEIEQNEKFNRFLETIIPKTRTLLRLVRDNIKYKLSIVDVVQTLEPFHIYPSDITYKQYQAIISIINERISSLKKEYVERSRELAPIRDTNYYVSFVMNSILRTLSEKKHLGDAFLKNYHFVEKTIETLPVSSCEVLNKILLSDQGNLYTSILSSILLSLKTPSNLTNILTDKANLEEMTDIEKILPTDCIRRYLTNRYTSVKELQKDQNTDEVFYDKEFDDTPYDILKKYKDEQKKMLPDLFFEFLKEILVQKHDCPINLAPEMATTLILGKKRVQDGEYAILEIRPQLPKSVDESKLSETEKDSIEQEAEIRKKLRYYRRVKNNWVHDDSIDEEAFLDTNTLFCNISDQCYKNIKNNLCETMETTSKNRMEHETQLRMRDEFDKRVEVSLEELEKGLEDTMTYFAKILKKTMVLDEIKTHRANNVAYQLGKQSVKPELLRSPNEPLLNMILAQEDFPKKQNDIIQFVEMFCRSPDTKNSDEDPNWLFCKATNTKLLPTFVFTLANEFSIGGDYQGVMARICHESGKISDDGDSIVDMHSGWVIRKIEYSTEEGFDTAGFHITTHSIMEKDMSTVIMEKLTKKEDPLFESEANQPIYNVFKVLCEHIDIPKEDIQEFVMRTTNEVMQKAIYSEGVYEKQSLKQKEQKGKGMRAYKLYYDEMLILIVACSLMVAIQTAVPSFKTKKTFPGCVRSFSGYPLSGGAEDLTGITYIACVIDKTKSSVTTWNAIQKLTVPKLVSRMKEIIEKFIVTRPEINELFVRKREYMLLHRDETAPHEHSISKWFHFLPPVVDYSISNVRNVTGEFETDFKELIKKGHREQHEYLNVLKSKAALFGFSVIESINNAVKKQNLLLKTSSRVPFTENACCNDNTLSVNPIRYFSNDDSNIPLYIQSAKKVGLLLNDVNILSKAPFLYDPKITGVQYPSIPTGYSEENIYSAFIKYGNYDRGLPVPQEYQVVCGDCPAGYNPNMTVSDKIIFLKKHGRQYTVEDLRNLLTLVNRNNQIEVSVPPLFTQADVLKDIIDDLDYKDSNVIERNMRNRFTKLLEKFKTKPTSSDVNEINKELDNLKDTLYVTNNRLYEYIMDFFQRYHKNVIKKDYDNILDFLEKIHQWRMDEGSDIYTNTLFLQNAILYFSKIYPTIIFNNAAGFYRVPGHWGFSDKDSDRLTTILVNHYEKLETFKGDKVILRLIQDVQMKLRDLNTFAQNIPVTADNSIPSLLDKSGVFYLLKYCFYSAIYEYIASSDDTELIHTDIEEFKSLRRDKINEQKNDANYLNAEIQTLSEELDEPEEDINEVQVLVGNKEELKERVCMLLLSYLDIENKNQIAIHMSYDDIMKKVGRSKMKEKRSFIEYLGKMTIEERGVEDQLKRNKIGIWNRGQQRGLVSYDDATNERETDDMMKQLIQDLESGEIDDVNRLVLESYTKEILNEENAVDEEGAEDDYRQDHTTDNFYDRGAYDISGLNKNFADGVYYEEDADPDDLEFED
uniref:Uncharacterized protein n=1 Tax=viral metagenome TaxID=1070528 RepID=A0A6C0DSA2_9ZZZZ